MSEQKHTPAPWHVIPDPAWVGKHPLHDARFVATCDFSKVEYELAEGQHGERPWRFDNRNESIICTMPDAPNQKANARLIAAAPELLSACWEVLQWACTPGEHGGNPYHLRFVKNAEIALAKAEGRKPESWASAAIRQATSN